MKPRTSLRKALDDPRLLGKALEGPSWRGWKALLLAAMGEELLPDELERVRTLTGRSVAPTSACSEFWVIAGRRAGKSRAIGCLSVYLASMCTWPMLSLGQKGLVLCFAADKIQAGVILDYAK